MKTILLTLMILNVAYADVNKDVQDEMKNYVNNLISTQGHLPIVYKGKILKLKVKTSKQYRDGFHSGVQNKGNLYVSCADFKDDEGNKYDIDFLVTKDKNTYKVVQPIVHSVNGEKNPYDLDH